MASAQAGPSRPRPVISNGSSSSSAGAGASTSASGSGTSRPGVVQPEPQRNRPRITGQGAGSTILVSSSQRGNPVLQAIRNVGWEYGDIVPDYQVGVSAAVLFLR